MKNSIILFILMHLLSAESLWDMYYASGQSNGYDRFIELEAGQVYTGGLGVYDSDVCIQGNGAVIDLQNASGIWAYGDGEVNGNIHVYNCSIVNGADFAFSFTGFSSGIIQNCNILQSYNGLVLQDSSVVDLRNTNFIGHSNFGVAVYDTSPTVTMNYCNAYDNTRDYMENCPG